MPLDPAFVADSPYGPDGLLLDEILEVDPARGLVVARMSTPPTLPLTREQRTHPVHHPPHLNGGLLVHMTGMLGFAHAYFVLGLRHREGWIGYGGRIHQARYLALARTGPPLLLRGWTTQVRRAPARVVARYAFSFEQEGTVVYASDQSAMWTNTRLAPDGARPDGSE